jgi:DUF971 family protein
MGSRSWCAGRPRACLGCSGCSGFAQALLRLCSPSAQVKAAFAHVRRLKRNQQQGKLILSLEVLGCTVEHYSLADSRPTISYGHAC